mmetsp:Transcript_8105/g.7190  ORF Transcript_8105/g.7190 Transcript_8105/m.7190 type:complete len:199 (+) Transcript_8105:618-1214(+)
MIDSDTSFSNDEEEITQAMAKVSTQKGLKRLPILPNRTFKHKPKIIDFSSNASEMNANQFDDNGNPHFNVQLDDDKFLSLSPPKQRLSKLRDYYNNDLWTHMHDFKKDGNTKIKNIRRKYRNILSPEVKLTKIISPREEIGDNVSEPPIIFAKRGYNDKFRYEQLKEINSLKDRLAKEGISCDTKTLRRAILMPEDII